MYQVHLTCRSYNCQVHLTFRTASNAINCGGKVCKECVDVWLCRHGLQLSRRMAESEATGLVSRVIKTHLLHSLPLSLSLSYTTHTHTHTLSHTLSHTPHTHTLIVIHHTHTHTLSLSLIQTQTYFRNEVFLFLFLIQFKTAVAINKTNKKHWAKNENVQMSWMYTTRNLVQLCCIPD